MDQEAKSSIGDEIGLEKGRKKWTGLENGKISRREYLFEDILEYRFT